LVDVATWSRLDGLHRRHLATRTAAIDRDEAAWTDILSGAPTRARMRDAVSWRPHGGDPEGYAVFEQRNVPGPDGRQVTELEVFELVATSSDAYRALIGYLAAHNNVRQVVWCAEPDDPLLHVVPDPAAVQVEWCYDKLVRLVDVRCAFQHRGPRLDAAPLTDPLLLAVDDPQAPWNNGPWAISQEGDRLLVEPTRAKSDVTVQAAVLGSLFTGFLSVEVAELTGGLTFHGRRRSGLRALFGARHRPFCADPL
jgi:predicted acetyltransferase